MTLSFYKLSVLCSFFCWCPLGSDAAFDYWCSFCNQPTLRNPSFCSEQHSSGSNKTFQRGKKIWIWLTSLYSQLPETQQGSGSTLGSQTDIKCQSPKVLFNTLQESFLGPVPVCLCLKESSNKYGYPVFLPKESGKSIRKGRRKKGEVYWQHTGSGCCHYRGGGEGRGLCVTKPNIPNHSSLWPFSEGKTVPQVLAVPEVYKPGGTRETPYLICSLIHISNNSTPENEHSKKKFYCLNKVNLDYAKIPILWWQHKSKINTRATLGQVLRDKAGPEDAMNKVTSFLCPS